MRLTVILLLLLIVQNSFAQDADAGRDTVVMAGVFPANYQLNASGSSSDVAIQNYYWVQDEDTIGNSMLLDVDIAEKVNRFQLIVEDVDGKTDTDNISIFLGHSTNNGMNRLPLRGGTEMKFVSGMNIAWRNFANDLNEFTPQDRAYYEEVMDTVSSNGGNALRWWLHTNGANTPIINGDGFVEGINFETIQGMKQVLDMAYDRGIVISMCLWSFDLLQNQNQDRTAMKLLLENPDNIQSYVDNALIPVLEILGDHPAVMTWEIFNEPEGMTRQFGWTPARIEMSDVQRFVNMCAGAIHRNTENGLVSNGAWSFRASTDVDGFTNFYSRERLIEAGGDEDGFMDFYQVHFYPEHNGPERSPFHRPASHWELDGPIVIGEFPADTIAGRINPGFSVERAYEVAVAYGYAGVMSWSWSSTSSFNRDFNTTARGLQKVAAMIPEALEIPGDEPIDRIPQVVADIRPFRSVIEETTGNEIFVDLADFIKDEEEDSPLDFTIRSFTQDQGVTPVIDNGSQVKLALSEPQSGNVQVVFRGADAQGWYADANSLIMLGSKAANPDNSAYYKPIYSSTEATGRYNLFANDGDLSTGWESMAQDFDTLVIDFESAINHNFLALHWDNVAVTQYKVLSSIDSITWEQVIDETHGLSKQIVYAPEEPLTARYLMLAMVNDNESRRFKVDEVITEYITDNQAPEVRIPVEDLTVPLSEVRDVFNYVRFSDVFTDQEHAEYLTYQLSSSNDELVSPELSISDVGINLRFGEGLDGTAEITATATDPLNASVSAIFTVTVVNDIVNVAVPVIPEIALYPNPVSDMLQLDWSALNSKTAVVSIISTQGQLIDVLNTEEAEMSINVKELSAGNYILQIATENDRVIKRFIKK